MNTNKDKKTIVLVGNPNVGKTTLFNELTGLRHTTANYPGVTVEKIAGRMTFFKDKEVTLVDLPGTYSLKPKSLDEEVVRNVLLGHQEGEALPDAVVFVIDADNLERNLFLALQVMEIGLPTVVALNMWDALEEKQKKIDLKELEKALGVRCVKTIGNKKVGLKDLEVCLAKVLDETAKTSHSVCCEMSAEERYQKIDQIISKVVSAPEKKVTTLSDKVDIVLTHPILGWACFIGLMALIFQSIFTWANPVMDMVSAAVDFLGSFASQVLSDGQLESLIVDGVIAGVGNVVVFLPQIFLLFFFIAFLEDSGYMARAAFVLDRVMKKVGLNGKAFLPLLSSFACAIPGIMATRTIQDKNDRLATILVAPLMSCSARLPVYALMIGAFIPPVQVLGFFNLKGVILLSMYLLSLFAGLGMATLFRKTFLKGNKTPFLFELPPYRMPRFKTVLWMMWLRGKEFLVNAGSIIFWISIVLWFLVSYPNNQEVTQKYEQLQKQMEQTVSIEFLEEKKEALSRLEAGERLETSFAGRLGKLIEPTIRPLGFDWKIGIGLVASFAAREVLVSTLAIIHNVGEDADETSIDLMEALQNERHPVTGKPIYTPLIAVALMVFFVLACQCMSTIAVVKRETRSWRWPAFMFTYMTLLAWLGAFVVFQGGKFLGFS